LIFLRLSVSESPTLLSALTATISRKPGRPPLDSAWLVPSTETPLSSAKSLSKNLQN
jgi:hypothetical protein